MHTPQKLGIKVFYYELSKKITTGLLLLIAAFVLLSFKSFLISKITLLLPAGAAAATVSYFTFGLFIISFLFIAGGILISWFYYIGCTFTLDEHSFNIRRGIFNKKETFIPYRQIEDIDIEQSFFHRIMGVSRLVILTAGDDNDKEDETEGIFEIIDSHVAEQMRKDILQKTHIQTVKMTPISPQEGMK